MFRHRQMRGDKNQTPNYGIIMEAETHMSDEFTVRSVYDQNISSKPQIPYYGRFIILTKNHSYRIGPNMDRRSQKIEIGPDSKIIVLPLEPSHCEKQHDLTDIVIFRYNMGIRAYYCKQCKTFYIFRDRLKDWSFNLGSTTYKRNELWFKIYRKYVSDKFETLAEYEKDRKRQEIRKMLEEKEKRIIKMESKLRKIEEKEQKQMARALRKRNGEPLGNMPKQRKRHGMFS